GNLRAFAMPPGVAYPFGGTDQDPAAFQSVACGPARSVCLRDSGAVAPSATTGSPAALSRAVPDGFPPTTIRLGWVSPSLSTGVYPGQSLTPRVVRQLILGQLETD